MHRLVSTIASVIMPVARSPGIFLAVLRREGLLAFNHGQLARREEEYDIAYLALEIVA